MPFQQLLKNSIMRFNLIFSLIIIVSACSNPQNIDGFARDQWVNDPMGCKSERNDLIINLMDHKAEITGLGQEEIVAVLGKPDKHELHARNKKAFTYYLSNGPDCQAEIENPAKLVIRFDGLGRSKEIIHYEINDK